MKPTLSLIIPCYNVERYVQAALQSVWTNTAPHNRLRIEWLMIDDGSQDHTGALLQQFASQTLQPANISHRIITQENAGLSAARNAAMDIAQGDYWLFLDSDDVFENQAIDKILAVIDSEQPDIIEFDATVFSENGRAGNSLYHAYFAEAFSLTRAFEENRWYVWSRCYHRKLFQQQRFEVGKLFEDMMTIPYLYLSAQTIFRLPESLLGYRQNANSITANVGLHHLHDIFYAMQKAIDAEKNFPENLMQLYILQDKTWRLLVAYAVKKFLRTQQMAYLHLIADSRKQLKQQYQRDWGWQLGYFAQVFWQRLWQ